MSNIREQVSEMAQLAIFSNRISEIHEKNLKLYPFIYFNDVNAVSITYDLSTSEKQTPGFKVHYKVVTKDNADNNHLENRLKALELAVQNLLWKDIVVTAELNGNIVSKAELTNDITVSRSTD